MQRYMVPEENWNSNMVQLSEEDAHHIVRVMRMSEGDTIICVRPDGYTAVCRLENVGSAHITAVIIEEVETRTELPVRVTIAQGLPKADKLEWIMQKGTEMGASAFLPFQADRSVVKWDEKKLDKKQQRLEKIVKEAAEQSSRGMLPKVIRAASFQLLLDSRDTYDHLFFAYEEAAKGLHAEPLKQVFQHIKPGQSILAVIGPEGGFSEKEAESLQAADFKAIRLGPRILRTETAPLYLLASLSYHFEE